MKLETNAPRGDTEQRPTPRPDTSGDGRHDDRLGSLAAERGIRQDILSAAGIGVNDGGGERHGWWSIPYPHRTGVWITRYRNPDPTGRPKYADRKGAEFHLYNPSGLGAGEEEVWFTEGEFDALALIDLGIPAIGISGASKAGNPDDEEDTGKWKREWVTLFEDTLCVMAFDNDDAGRKAARSLSNGLARYAVPTEVFDEWPDGVVDLNEWLIKDREGMGDSLNRWRNRVRDGRGMEPARMINADNNVPAGGGAGDATGRLDQPEGPGGEGLREDSEAGDMAPSPM